LPQPAGLAKLFFQTARFTGRPSHEPALASAANRHMKEKSIYYSYAD